ncbi:TSC22 domain family protein 2-like isoform X2 [Carassius gibelio]|uniref:TSC22 domain family protein 2-like isoform X2 n=1 Tax=Carassius gibelio TaxID=101364 RepID=UPI0022788105|nr:TSC22 domain family protein 2-like isoform X2 [Carassius gibelio]
MSAMTSKKKSCFQITSVTQAAQVAANSHTDDTESLEGPDEPRTENMSSSEIYDMSKPGDLQPETCAVSLSDESLHNGAETSGQDGPMWTVPGSRSTGAVHMNPGGTVSSLSSGSAASQTSSLSSSAPVGSCSSRFRVIKLDHGTGEPIKRGRWTCAEFYERDTDASSSARTVDNVKYVGTTDHGVDALGAAGGSVAAHVGLSAPAAEPHADSGYISAPSNPPVEAQQQPFGVSQQGLGLVNLNGDAHAQHLKSPSMPSTTQPQPFFPGTQAQKPVQTVTPSNPAQSALGTSLPGGAHMLGFVPQPVDGRGLLIAQPEHVQGLLQQPGISTALGSVSAAAVVQQAPVPLIQPAVTASVSALAGVPGVQNVPAVMSSASNAPQSMPKQMQQHQPQGVHSGSLVGLGGLMTPANFSQLPSGVTQTVENQRNPDGLLQSHVLMGTDAIKPLQLHTPAVRSLFGIAIPIDGDEDSASGASAVAIDNKIEQAMDLVKSHLMYAVREEVEVLKEQIKELYERNSLLERENAVLKSLANTEQLTQLSTSPPQTPLSTVLQGGGTLVTLPPHPNVSTA